ncbi:uncharacterized protein LOC121051552 [Rosa chinensis]|uniref:uncharacterized protein LOC121051552 n=1 Tax=Rosa chinensis TaxID=74649 RepID=UPI001AD90641|nr:uncharacterized protein LOC121051552 [Rosa chinensis]
MNRFYWTLQFIFILDKDIVVILCKLELNFPPSFFNIMTHLPIHLAYEAILAGPVQYRWMFPFERKMHNLKDYCRNKAHPEGLIAEGYCDSECLTFCSMYFRDIKTKFNQGDRNHDVNERRMTRISVFNQNVRFLKGAVDDVLSLTDFATIRWYVLNNCDEVLPNIREHKAELERQNITNIGKEQQQRFQKWFLGCVQQMQVEGSLCQKVNQTTDHICRLRRCCPLCNQTTEKLCRLIALR